MLSDFSSSRSIKRKKFDDEIVEFGTPPAQLSRTGRSRTHSQTYVAASTSVSAITTVPAQVVTSPTYSFSEPSPITTTVSTPVTDLNVADSTVNLLQPNTSATVTQLIPTAEAPSVSTSVPLPASTPVVKTPLIPQLPQQHQLTVSMPTAERRRPSKPIGSGKKSKKTRPHQQLTTKDLGRWKPIDDLSLIVGIQQTNDLRIVHQGVKFSCKFTLQELQSRWYSLLYDEPISRIAVAAMRNLHPELVESVHSKALYTTQEEELLGTIKSVSILIICPSG